MKIGRFFRKIYAILGLVMCLSFLNGSAAWAVLGRSEFESIQKVSQYILEKYPPAEYAYLGIGRSPVAVLAYLKTEDGTWVRNLPLSSFRFGNRFESELSETEKNRLYVHFDEFIPNDHELGGRSKILLVDFAYTGHTLVAAELAIEAYLASRGRALQVQALAITTSEFANRYLSKLKDGRASDLDQYFLKHNPDATFEDHVENDHLLMLMMQKLYKDRAEFTSYNPKKPTPVVRRSQYDLFVEEIRKAKLGLLEYPLDDHWIRNYRELMLDMFRIHFISPPDWVMKNPVDCQLAQIAQECYRLVSQLSGETQDDCSLMQQLNEYVSKRAEITRAADSRYE